VYSDRCLNPPVPRVPLLSGSRLVVASAPADARVLRPPPPGRATDVVAATREALRFPLDGEPLEALAAAASRATIVVEPPALPIGSVQGTQRPAAIAAVSEALAELGVPSHKQTLLIAGGLARRASRPDIAALVTPEFRRRFHGVVAVHDAADPDLAGLPAGAPRVRVARELVETDLVVVVSAAESVLHGGPATLLAAADAETQRNATAESLLETGGSEGWRLASLVERSLAAHVPLFGVSLVLNHPQYAGPLRGYPYEPEAAERIARSPLRLAFSAAPESVRHRVIRALHGTRTTAAVLAGPPSVAHAEALLRAIELRRATLDEPLDALVVGIPGTTPFLPREQPNPLLAAHLGLAHALGLWRDAFPVREGGIVILVHRFRRAFARPTQQPYHVFFRSDPIARNPDLLAAAESAVAADGRAVEEYRAGRTVHPLLPFRDWEACQPALERLGAVYVAGARDAAAVRQLGFVPIGGIGAALQMTRGHRGPDARIGFLLAPPYFPLRVGSDGT
jgi:Lactate racemase N-terminal domain